MKPLPLRFEFAAYETTDGLLEPPRFETEDEARGHIAGLYEWKEEARKAFEENEALPFDKRDTNEPWWVYNKRHFGRAPIKDREWVVARREVSQWERVEGGVPA